jgi:VIT1/CCC1 family predicted Fe2+/Mn2+ transporter
MGAISGYYTNKLAISHLFTDIPLPGGSWRAVIKKGGNKERLAQDLAEIAEDKILGEHTERGEASYLYQELSKESVLNALDECVLSVFSELKKSEAAKKNVIDILQEYFSKEPGNKILKQAVQTVAADHKIGDFISEQTFVSFCGEVWKNDLFPEISEKKGEILEKVFLELSRSKEPVTIERIAGKELCDQTEAVLAKKALAILEKMNQDSDRMKLEGYLHAICRQLGIGSIVRNVLLGLREKTVGEIVDSDAFAEISFSKEIKIILEQRQIYDRLQAFFEMVKKELEDSELTVADLLPEGCLESDAVAEMLSGQIKKLQPFAGDLYEDNREFISERIGEELNHAIEEGTGNFLQNMVLLGAKDMILEKMEQFLKENVPEKLKHFMEDPSEETCKKLCRMAGELPVKGILEKITFDTVFSFLEKELLYEENGRKTDQYIAEKISGISLGFIFNDDTVDFISKKADSLFPEMISKWLNGEEKEEQVKNIVHVIFKKICHMPLGETGAKELAEMVDRSVLTQERLKKVSGEAGIFSILYKKCSGIYVEDLLEKILKILSESKESSKEYAGESSKERLEEEHLKESSKDSSDNFSKMGIKTITVENVISMIPVEEVQKKVRSLFTEKAAGYFQIKPIVKEKVLALDDDMLGSMMQKFMGTQLRPLNLIGGALGAVVGLLLFFLNPSKKMTAVSVVITMLCYALIGIGTNVLALHGLFRPYHVKERKWLGAIAEKDGFLSKAVMGCYHLAEKIPGIRMIFCLGYIPEKKNTIAKQLADFVAVNFLEPKDLLPNIDINMGMVQNFIKDQGKPIADKVVSSLKQADWESVIKNVMVSFFDIGRKDSQFLSGRDFSVSSGVPASDEMPHSGNQAVNRERSGSGISDWISAGLVKKENVSFLEESVYDLMEKGKDQPVEHYVTAEAAAEKISGYLEEQVSRLGGRPDEIMEKVQNIYQASGKESVFWKEKKVAEYLPEQKTEFLERMAGKLSSFLLGEKFCDQVKEWLVRVWDKKARQKNRSIASFFDGKAGRLLERNLDGLETFFLNMIKREVYRYLLEHEDELVEKIDLEVQGMLNHAADGMAIGGMASSMLGTRQIIEKVFHRTFLEPSYSSWENETEEIVVKERLSDELIDRNERRLREKIGELLTDMSFATFGDLEQFLFPQEAYRTVSETLRTAGEQGGENPQEAYQTVDNTDENRESMWISRLCQTVFGALRASEGQGRETVFAVVEQVAERAGEYRLGECVSYADSGFIKNGLRTEVLDGVVKAVQKPSTKQEITEFLVYFLNSYLWKDSIGTFFAFSRDSLALVLQNCGEILCRQKSVLEAVGAFLVPVGKRLSQEKVLWKELSGKLKETESIYDGTGEFVLGIASSVSEQTEGSVYELLEELADCMNKAFRYEEDGTKGIVSVAEKIDFARIIYRAVMDMSDRQIEELFKGFAGQYFLSLKMSGALGFVFGIPVVQWIAVVGAVGSEFFGGDKEKKD